MQKIETGFILPGYLWLNNSGKWGYVSEGGTSTYMDVSLYSGFTFYQFDYSLLHL